MRGYAETESRARCAANSWRAVQQPLLLVGRVNEHALQLAPGVPCHIPASTCQTQPLTSYVGEEENSQVRHTDCTCCLEREFVNIYQLL